MTFPPKEIYKTALFLASKTEATHITLSDYSRRISSKAEDILAPEYKLMQALRFTLDVKQPFRGLKGALMELLNMADGMPDPTSKSAMTAMLPPPANAPSAWRQGSSLQDRVQAAYHASKAILDNEALITDAYFLYTPSQIMFAALSIADPPLAEFYVSSKVPADPAITSKIMAVISACAEMLSAKTIQPVLTKNERAAMEDRLEQCRDPSTRDLVKAHQARKAGEAPDEDKIRRRQLERERNEQEGHDMFGPTIRSNGAG